MYSFAKVLLLVGCTATYASPSLEVYAIAHTHLDVGWLQTFDSYYYLNVSGMIPTVMSNLVKDPSKRFTWAEMSYFQKWWATDASANDQQTLRSLVKNGQFEFVDGGVVQHDQACPITEDIVDQMTLGHSFLLNEFGIVPKVGWSLDPFGSSTSNAALYALMGYNALVINRIPSRQMDTMRANQELQFIWQASQSLDQQASSMFTHVFDSYFCTFGPSYPFVWSWSQGDGPHINSTNVAKMSLDLAHSVLPRADWFRTNKIMIPWGCDFAYQNATIPFMYSDLLWAEINAHPEIYNMTIKYATPSEYFAAIHNENRTWPTREFLKGDFFPLQYQTDVGAAESINKNKTEETKDNKEVVVAQQVWSSFYTSRPSLKLASRKALGAIYAAQGMSVLARAVGAKADFVSSFQTLQQAQFLHSIALHHDAITGTMCHPPEGCTGGDQSGGDHYVLTDYLSMQQRASDSSENVLSAMISSVASLGTTQSPPSLLPISQDDNWSTLMQRHKPVVLVLYNPLAFDRHEIISLPVPTANLLLSNASGVALPSVTLSWNTAQGFARNPERFNQHIHFAADIPALGFATYFLTPCPQSSSFPFNCVNTQPSSNHVATGKQLSSASGPEVQSTAANNVFEFQLENEYLVVYCDNVTGVLGMLDKATQRNYSLALDLRSYALQNRFDMPAYVFDPVGASQPILKAAIIQTVLWKTEVVDQAFFQISNDHSLTIRVYKNASEAQGRFVELEYVVGPLDPETSAVVQITTDIKGANVFTDMNSFEMTSRTMNDTLTIPENSWPTQRSAYLRSADGNEQLSVVCEQTHALIQETNAPGQFQLMLQTRAMSSTIPHDDLEVHIQKIWLAVGSTLSTNRARHAFQQRIQHPARAVSTEGSQSTWSRVYRTKFSPLASPLQENTQGLRLFALAPLDGTSSRSVLRIHHDFEAGEDPVLSLTCSLDLSLLFANPISIASVVEKSLTLNQNQSNLTRWTWQKQSAHAQDLAQPTALSISALQLRSYELTFA